MRKQLTTVCAVAAACLAVQTATAQYFANDLTDAASALTQFSTNCASEGSFGFSTDNIITVLNPTNTTMTVSRTNITAGASVFATSTNDTDAVRSYLATLHGAYSTTNWKAHIAVESPASGDPNDNFVFIGIGEGVPFGVNNEPLSGDRAYVRWRHGYTGDSGRPRTYVNGDALETSTESITTPGTDVYITHNADTGLITFQFDNWDGGVRSNGVNLSMSVNASSLGFSGDTEARIFFGGNATVTFSDFSVEEYVPPVPGAQFFTNNLQDEVSATDLFNVNLGSEGSIGFSSSEVITVLNPTNTTMTVLRTNMTAGASVFATSTNDTDACRSYLATQYGAYSTTSWKAHVALESPGGDPVDNWVWFGIGAGVPTGANNEPTSGDYAAVRLRYGSTASHANRLYVNGGIIDSGAGVTTPGTDMYITYLADSGTMIVELDNWDGGVRSNGVNTTMIADISALGFSGDTEARIFFGGNATITFSDFSVAAFTPVEPTIPLNMYAWPDTNNIVTVRWDEESLSDSYNVYRSLEESDNYSLIANVATNFYVDSVVTNGVTYYYKVAGTNVFGEGVASISDFAVPTPYYIIGTDNNNGVQLSKHQLFDGYLSTFFDTPDSDSWAGLDYGAGNEKEIVEVSFTYRNWGAAKGRSANHVIQGANLENFSDAVTLHTITGTDELTYPNANIISVTNSTLFRYVRIFSPPVTGRPVYCYTELAFISTDDFTSNGTPKYWLDEHYNVLAGFGGDYELADLDDSDGDGHKAWQEYIAGTIPTDGGSILELNSISNTVSGLILSWQSVEDKSYSIITNTSLIPKIPGVAVSNITGLATETSYTTTVSGASSVFYEIGVE